MYPKNEKKPTLHLVAYNEKGIAEDFQEVQEIVKVTKRHFKKGEFFMQSFMLNTLIMEKDYKLLDLKILITLEQRLDYNNRIKTFRQYEIAKELGSDQSRISKTIKRLVADGIIYKENHDYYFSDKYIKYAGDNKSRKPK